MDIRRGVSRSNIAETLRSLVYYGKGLDRPRDKLRNFVPVSPRNLHCDTYILTSLIPFPVVSNLFLPFPPSFFPLTPPPPLSLSSFLCLHPSFLPFTIPLFNLSSMGAARRDAGLAPKMDSGIEGSAVGFSGLYSRRELYGIFRDSSVLRYRDCFEGASL